MLYLFSLIFIVLYSLSFNSIPNTIKKNKKKIQKSNAKVHFLHFEKLWPLYPSLPYSLKGKANATNVLRIFGVFLYDIGFRLEPKS